jgi:PBP1b-binding outer membrane lipoprotein LpoB
MKHILTIALCALMLSGCMAEWKSPRTGQRWKDTPANAGGNSPSQGTACNPVCGGP